MELVRKFIDENRASLIGCIAAYRQGQQRTESFEKLVQLEREWKTIPRKEKQIPYQAGEKEFWFAYHTLHILLNPKPVKNPRGETLDAEHSAWDIIRGHLDIAEQALINNAKLPEDIDARRILP